MRRCLFLFLALRFAPGAPANPLFDGADPHAEVFGGSYWIYPTGGAAETFSAYSSSDLTNWKSRGVVLDFRDIDWIRRDGAPRHHAWAPAMVARNGKGYFYYSVGPQNPTPSRIGVAVGERPEGPFIDSGKPLVTGGDGFEAIDPMVFSDPKDNVPYLYAGGSNGSRLRVWELNPDMVSIKREIPVETPRNFTEGPFMHVRDGIYYLSYSHGRWNDASYSVHYATAGSPVGPWTYRGPILQSDATHKGPGHHSFVRNPRTKEDFIVYHRWETTQRQGSYHGKRQIAVDRVQYAVDGTIQPIRMTDGGPRSGLQ